MKKFKTLVIAVTFLFCSYLTHARIKEIRDERKFSLKMEETPFAVVLFYSSQEADKDERLKIRYLKRDLQYVVQDPGLYKNAQVRLLSVDAAHDGCIVREFGITNFPSIMLFKGGLPVKNKDGKFRVLSGYAPRNAIRTFIDKYLREDVMDFMEDKYAHSQRAQMDRTYLYFSYGMTLPTSVQYAYPYYYWPDPYYGYAAPGIGVELGF